MHVLPAVTHFVPYAHLNPRAFAVAQPNLYSTPLVMHAPTHRGIKGTKHVLEAVERLKADGVPFRFELIEGLSHAEALQRYRDADLLIDQLLLGWYGGLAVELMALGKPVICHLRESDLRFIPQGMRKALPIIRAHPGDLYEVLKVWLTNRKQELPEVGARCRAFVEHWHDPLPIAASMIEDYRQARAGARRAKAG
jgi:glycosyltransferase involved in cell wall biosynthesis